MGNLNGLGLNLYLPHLKGRNTETPASTYVVLSCTYVPTYYIIIIIIIIYIGNRVNIGTGNFLLLVGTGWNVGTPYSLK